MVVHLRVNSAGHHVRMVPQNVEQSEQCTDLYTTRESNIQQYHVTEATHTVQYRAVMRWAAKCSAVQYATAHGSTLYHKIVDSKRQYTVQCSRVENSRVSYTTEEGSTVEYKRVQ